MLRAGRVTTFAVAVSVTFLAVLLAVTGKSIFSVLVTFNTVIALAYGPPALLDSSSRRRRAGRVWPFCYRTRIGAIGTFVFGWDW